MQGPHGLILAIALGAALLPGPTRAEQPSWADTVRPFYALLRHSRQPAELKYQGLWRFDAETGQFRRLGPFSFYLGYYHVESSSLTNLGDRLLFEGWPALIEFDVASAKPLRRYPPMADPAAWGWILQGFGIDRDTATSLGVSPGVYGYPRCVAPWVFVGAECPPYSFPGGDNSLGYYWYLVERRGAEADQGGLALFADLRPAGLDGPLASFDEERRGFWTIPGREAVFLSLTEGRLELQGAQHTPLPATLLQPSWVLNSLTPIPGGGGFLAVRQEDGRSTSEFLRLDASFTPVRTYSSIPQSGEVVNPFPRSLTSLPASPPTQFEQLIPIVAHTAGLRSTFWTSDLWLFNPSVDATTVGIRRVAAPGAGEHTVELAGHASLVLRDVLALFGGGPGGDGVAHDALVLTSPFRWGEQVVAVSRSSTPFSGGGTAGHAVTALPGRLGYSNHLSAFESLIQQPEIGKAAQLILDVRDAGRYRHNLGVVNDADSPLAITLSWGAKDFFTDDLQRPPEADVTITIAPHSVAMRAIEPLFPQSVRDRWPANLSVIADRPAAISLAMVDNLTGDATFVPFTLLILGGDDETRLACPVVAHLPGERGTFWKTDFYGAWADDMSWPEGHGLAPKAYFHPVSPTNCGGAPGGQGELEAYLDGVLAMRPEAAANSPLLWPTIFPDVARQLGPCAGDGNVRGALELRAISWMNGYTRTYTVRADGGTFGDMLPLYPARGWPVQHFAGIELSPEFRVNLGLFNGDKDHSITHRLRLYAADGHLVAQRELVLAPWQNTLDRIERLLGVEVGSLPEGTYGLTVLPLDDPANGVEGRSWAFVSLVDNASGDPTNWW